MKSTTEFTKHEQMMLNTLQAKCGCPAKAYSYVDGEWKKFCIKVDAVYGREEYSVKKYTYECTKDALNCWKELFTLWLAEESK